MIESKTCPHDSGTVRQVKQNKKQQITVTIPQNGGLVIVNQ